MTNWLSLSRKDQIELFNQIGSKTGLQPFAIEKDAWVTLALRILFSSEIGAHIVFKGGTSLSKAYGLIDRFSEDVDFAIDRGFLGFEGDLTKGQIRKLRRQSHKFSSNQLPRICNNKLSEYGIEKDLYEITIPNKIISDQDPEIIHLNYKSVFEEDYYLQSRVLIEIGARSLMEPFKKKEICSFIDVNYSNASFSEDNFIAQTVIPEKTFLEKLILLHEEFQKPTEKIRYHRMSRHLYDIWKIFKTKYASSALKNRGLFKNILEHREKYTPVKNVDYKTLKLHNLNFLPPDNLINYYQTDYKEMQSTMIYGESLIFDMLIEELKSFKDKIVS